MSNFTKAVVLDLDETLVHGYCKDKIEIMILRPNIDKLIEKLQQVKEQNIDIIICTTSRNNWVNKFLELRPIFKNIFDRIYTRDNEEEWRYFDKKNFPLEYNAKSQNINLEYLKPITTFGYDQVLYIDDNKLEEIRLQILFELTKGQLYKDITFFTGFKFYRKSMIWEKILDYCNGINENFNLNQRIKEYLKLEKLNPGCDMIISAINSFVNKPFKQGLSVLDKVYFNEYKQYDERMSKLQQEIQKIIECEKV